MAVFLIFGSTFVAFLCAAFINHVMIIVLCMLYVRHFDQDVNVLDMVQMWSKICAMKAHPSKALQWLARPGVAFISILIASSVAAYSDPWAPVGVVVFLWLPAAFAGYKVPLPVKRIQNSA